jgi:PAS domain S-box-containing protein
MADTVPQIVWITDADGGVEFFNKRWRDYTGISYDHETAADVAASTVHPDDVAITMDRFARAQATGGMFEVEHRIRSASGSYRWFLVRAQPYRDPDTNAILHWFGTSMDIHDRVEAEVALQQLAARQRFQLALADHIRPLADPQEIVRVASGLLGAQLHADRVFYGEVDPSAQFIDLMRDWTSGAVPSMAGRHLRLNDFGVLVAEELRHGRTLAVSDVTSDEKSTGHAGAYLANDVRSFLAIPLIKQGRLKAILSVHRADAHHWTALDKAMADDMVDRTWEAVERARAQTKLRTERDRSRSVFRGMREGFAIFSSDWTVLEMNDEGLRIAQRAGSDVIGRNHWDIWPQTIGSESELRFRRVMETRLPETWEYQPTFDNGPAAWIELRAYPAGEHDLAVFFRDITERKKTEQKLRDADRRKDEFLAMLAHELRNPLAPIGAAAQLLQTGRLDDARLQHTSQIVARQVTHMTHLIDDLLDVSRVTRGLVKLEKAPLDIRRIVVDAVEQVTPLIQARRHQLSLHLPPEAVTVLGDRKRLVQVLANILNNAAKYTDEGGNISLKAEVQPSHVVFDVSDNGIGMAADLSAHVFDLFAQAERSADRSAGGLGLGLALVKNLVELHGGLVTCNSDGPGQGSTFHVRLPRIEAQGRPDHALHADRLQKAVSPLRIMVVDDNADAARMLALLLESMGHQVVIAHGSRRALELAGSDAPEVYLLDIGLPEMDGNELARQLRALPHAARPVLIAVTGYGQEADRRRTLAAGFDYHLVKPVDMQELTEILSLVPGR